MTFQKGDRIKFTGFDSSGIENFGGHYTVIVQKDNVVMAQWEGDKKAAPLLLDVDKCKMRKFKKKVE